MTPDEARRAHVLALATLPTDAQRLTAYQALRDVDRLAAGRPVIMCGCADWLACAHPWPARVGLR